MIQGRLSQKRLRTTEMRLTDYLSRNLRYSDRPQTNRGATEDFHC